jgi:hypothetical protein
MLLHNGAFSFATQAFAWQHPAATQSESEVHSVESLVSLDVPDC